MESKMKKRIYFSIQNGGDGSAYPRWFESEELAEWDQRHMDEGWGEPCCGYVEAQSDSEITFNEEITTIEDIIKEKEEALEWALKYKSEWSANPDTIRDEIHELKVMKEKRDD
jgi:hypothetical protein